MENISCDFQSKHRLDLIPSQMTTTLMMILTKMKSNWRYPAIMKMASTGFVHTVFVFKFFVQTVFVFMAAPIWDKNNEDENCVEETNHEDENHMDETCIYQFFR